MLYQKFLKLRVLFKVFSLCSSVWVSPTALSSRSLILASASFRVLLNPSCVFLSLVTLFFSDLFFYLYSLIFYCYISLLVLTINVSAKFHYHFMTLTLNLISQITYFCFIKLLFFIFYLFFYLENVP